MTVSPDGKHLYAAGLEDDAVAVFSRDSTTGELTFVEVQKDGVGGVDGLQGATSVTVSPDGKHLYAAGRFDFAVAVFSRNSTTGELTFVEVVKDGVGGADGLDGPRSVTVSPDGKHIYTAGTFDDAVAVFSRNSTTGELTFVEVQKDGVGGVDGLYGAVSVTVSPDGKHLYAAGANDSAVAVFSRNSTTGSLTFVEVHEGGVGGIDGLITPFSVTVSPDGKHLYAAGRDDHAVVVFSRDSTTGSLTFVEVQKDGVGGVDGLDQAFSVTVSPDGKHLYAAGRFDFAVAVFSRNSTTGELTFVEVVKDGDGGIDGLDQAFSVTVSPDGKHVYTAGWGDDAVAVFSRDSTTGELTFVEVQKDGDGGVDGLEGVWSVTVSPDGKHLYAAGAADDAVAVFSRDSTTGELTFVEVQKDGVGGVDGLDLVFSVTVSPDGKHLYTAGGGDDAVAVFSRDSTTGELIFVEVVKDGVGGVDGLSRPRSVMVSPDGKHIYAAGDVDDAVAVFNRNSTTGSLTFVEFVKVGVVLDDGFFGAFSVTVSPDGKHIYVGAGVFSGAVAVFSRDSTTGSLTFVEVQKDGVGGVDGLAGARSVTVSPDGKHLYAAGQNDNAVAVFNRDSTTGSLTFVEVQKDGIGGVDGLAGARSVTVSPDGKYLYAASRGDHAVAVFSRSTTIPSADIEVTKTDNPDPVTAGTNLTYVITVTNNSTSTTATNIEVKDKLPPGTSLVSAIATGGSCNGTTDITCTFSSLAAGASTTATIVVKVNAGASGSLTNVASTTADTMDSVLSNNSFKAVTQVTPTTPVPSVSAWALAVLAGLLLLTFSGRVRRRIMRRTAVGD